jgi:hypothetical protein
MAGTVALFLVANTSVQAGTKKTPTTPAAAAVVAPIFDHGEGRGATGCIVVAPPVFLSEEEAWQVINEELGRRSLELPEKAFEVRGVKIPHRMSHYGEGNKVKIEDVPGTAEPYKADRADPKKRIGVEFVSQRDYDRLGGASSMSTVQLYDMKEVAQSVADTVGKNAKEKLYFGVLYDPVGRMESSRTQSGKAKTREERTKFYAESARKSKAESERLLRLQVQDFLKWLQAQGAI